MSAGPDVLGAAAPWQLLLAVGTATVPVPRDLRARRQAVARLRALPEQSPVALVARGPWGRGQLRRTAARCGVVLDHEYVVLPGLDSTRYVVEDHPDTIAVLWSSLAAPPPRLTRGTMLLTAVASIGRRRAPWWALGALLPRVATGHRS